jgi:general secretion pathway protein H
MSAIGKPDFAKQGVQGFTLIELLVALAIMALITGLGFPALQSRIAQFAQAQARSDIVLALGQARSDAIARAAPVRLALGQDRVLRVSSGRGVVVLPQGVDVVWPQQGFVFYPDGSAQGGTGEIHTSRSRSRFSIEAGTGRLVFAP